ncbi:MAG: ribonuclease III [Anaerolineaceae bacterium]|nr:ribonuclease III [Anaerolineaceae bacterium]
MAVDVNKLETITHFIKRLNLTIKDDFLISRALTHRSYLNENREALEDNERLEFFGDSILSFIVAEWIYNKFPDKPEGSLTRLRSAIVYTEQLAEFAKVLDLGQAIRLGNGEVLAGGRERPAILCDAFEALIGAIYLDSGLEAVKKLVYPLITESIDNILINHQDEDTKSNLQEWAQANGYSSPKYLKLSEMGPDHAKTFKMEVVIDGQVYGQGIGASKQAAEKDAAKNALSNLGILET